MHQQTSLIADNFRHLAIFSEYDCILNLLTHTETEKACKRATFTTATGLQQIEISDGKGFCSKIKKDSEESSTRSLYILTCMHFIHARTRNVTCR